MTPKWTNERATSLHKDETSSDIRTQYRTLAVVGLGYVGLPSAVYFAEAGFRVVGVDVKPEAIERIRNGTTHLPDLGMDERVRSLVKSGSLQATTDLAAATKEADAIFIMVPTPLGADGEPDLSHIVNAGREIGRNLRQGQLVILESTVYPGVTEEVLLPQLESGGLKAGRDFGLAYCPERYNPGDPEHTIEKTRRIVGGFTAEDAQAATTLYGCVTKAIVVNVGDIRTCEAAKVIENTQRDVNIALANEMALMCEVLGLDVNEVLDAAATKWNFVRYKPGPGVGGHCLPKDPHYLASVAERAGYKSQIVTAARRLNDGMPGHVFDLVKQGLEHRGLSLAGARVAVLGLAYKPNLGDTRLTPSLDLTQRLAAAGARVITVDPHVSAAEATKRFGAWTHTSALDELPTDIDAVVLMVAHDAFQPLPFHTLIARTRPGAVFVDGPRAVPFEAAREAGWMYLGVGAGRANREARARGSRSQPTAASMEWLERAVRRLDEPAVREDGDIQRLLQALRQRLEHLS